MKRILNSMVAAALAAGIGTGLATGLAGQAAAADLTIRIEGMEQAAGTFHIAVFEADGWDENQTVASGRLAAEEGAELTLTGLVPGAYGIKIFQDVDDNGQLNLGIWGIPSEPYGFSNDAPARGGPPSFRQASFKLAEPGTVQTIKLH
jgi:uncharacterized protein (DUF2141 family)